MFKWEFYSTREMEKNANECKKEEIKKLRFVRNNTNDEQQQSVVVSKQHGNNLH